MTSTNDDNEKTTIGPHDGTSYNDQFWIACYSTICNFGLTEVRLIWMRYSAFLIAHSTLLGLMGFAWNAAGRFLLIQSVVGLVLTLLWMMMNSLGWTNQNLWYWQAANLRFSGLSIRLP